MSDYLYTALEEKLLDLLRIQRKMVGSEAAGDRGYSSSSGRGSKAVGRAEFGYLCVLMSNIQPLYSKHI